MTSLSLTQYLEECRFDFFFVHNVKMTLRLHDTSKISIIKLGSVQCADQSPSLVSRCSHMYIFKIEFIQLNREFFK